MGLASPRVTRVPSGLTDLTRWTTVRPSTLGSSKLITWPALTADAGTDSDTTTSPGLILGAIDPVSTTSLCQPISAGIVAHNTMPVTNASNTRAEVTRRR